MTGNLQARVDAFLGAAPEAEAAEALPVRSLFKSVAPAAPVAARRILAGRPFSIFVSEDMQVATELSAELKALADELSASRPPEEVLEAVLDRAAGQSTALGRGAAEHALKLFITHEPVGRQVRVPSLLKRMAPAAAALPDLGGKTTSPEEDRLNWFREDPLANEHHEHWHLVYPRTGAPDLTLRKRHGEMFFYMHQQMLARYDCERRAARVPPVVPFSRYDQSVGAGYDAADLTVGGEGFVARPADARWEPLPPGSLGEGFPGYTVADHEARRQRFETAIARGALQDQNGNDVPLVDTNGSDLLGLTGENTKDSVSGPSFASFYGNLHGFGHVMAAHIGASGANWGVMATPSTAIRDPFFWRWHRHIDDLSFAYQEGLTPHDFNDAPPVRFSGDGGISLFHTADVPAGADPKAFLEAALAGARVGGATGDEVVAFTFAAKPHRLHLRGVLETEMRTGVYTLTNGQRYRYPYLWHEPFGYAIRLRNEGDTDLPVTVRLFLCPTADEAVDGSDPVLENRRNWIEMDKFAAELPAGAESVLVRADTESSVIRRPAVDPANVEDIDPAPTGDPNDRYCECGWPYHLLLPRGRPEGMRFMLLGLVTDGRIDRLPQPGHCGSMSFCGARDEYPDTRPMGYPFDRPLGEPLPSLVARLPSWTLRPVVIRTADAG